MSSVIALIPARCGSKRIPGKNIRELAGHPLIAYTISAAIRSGEFDRIVVSSDDVTTLEVACQYGADVLKRPDEFASDTSPDIEWVTHTLRVIGNTSMANTFAILRPTSPFRTAETIQRAFRDWRFANATADPSRVTALEGRAPGGATDTKYSSLRAVERVSQHPGKMWQKRGSELVPLMLQPLKQPFHDSQLAALPEIYVQNASLEIARVETIEETETISGRRVLPFLTVEYEGFDINSQIDWKVAEILSRSGEAGLPRVDAPDSIARTAQPGVSAEQGREPRRHRMS